MYHNVKERNLSSYTIPTLASFEQNLSNSHDSGRKIQMSKVALQMKIIGKHLFNYRQIW